jgi:uncharacterized membrane protein YcjF (UPF0283 family)
LVSTPEAIEVLKIAYCEAIRGTMIVALVAICISNVCTLGMEWLTLPKAQAVQNIDQTTRNVLENAEKRKGLKIDDQELSFRLQVVVE